MDRHPGYVQPFGPLTYRPTSGSARCPCIRSPNPTVLNLHLCTCDSVLRCTLCPRPLVQKLNLRRLTMRSLTFASLLLSGVLAQKTQVSTTVYDQLSRYARFASASYSSSCANPPFGSSVAKYFVNTPTDTQVTLFRDDNAKEYILSFRGTSSVQDFVTDLDQTLVSCSAADGISCLGCTVG